jgi:hypothetical protein
MQLGRVEVEVVVLAVDVGVVEGMYVVGVV